MMKLQKEYKERNQTNKTEWREVELGDERICLISGEYGSGASASSFDGKIRYIRITDIDENGNLRAEKVSPNKTEDKYFLKRGDLLFARSGATVGKTYLHKKEDNFQYAGYLIRFRFNNKVVPEYAYFFTKTQKYLNWVSLVQNVVAQPNINAKQYSSLKIPLPFSDGKPDLKEQERIVRILEKAEKQKERGKKANELLDEYLKSVFNEMFYNKGFEEKPLFEITKFIDYLGKTPKKTEYGILLITAKNVRQGYISNEPKEFIAEEDYLTWMRRGFPKEGDILFTTEAPLGNVARLGKFDKIALAQRVITFQCSKGIDSYYLLYALLSDRVKKSIGIQSTGSTVTGIRSRELKQIKIPLPPLLLQQKFSKIVEQVEKMKGNVKKTNSNSENLFNSLMQKAFRGEL